LMTNLQHRFCSCLSDSWVVRVNPDRIISSLQSGYQLMAALGASVSIFDRHGISDPRISAASFVVVMQCCRLW